MRHRQASVILRDTDILPFDNYACDARYGEILSDVTDMFFEIKSQLLYFNAEAYEKKKIKKAITKN